MTEAELKLMFDRFRGHLAGYVEALDLPHAKERTLVSRIKSESYDLQRDIAEQAVTDGSNQVNKGHHDDGHTQAGE
jgi:hypothetical protein